ncbi:hypothetical protein SNOG_20150 [Parastagonospora nodorum SN15]|uniref:Uncharacterized protein n=1 Tax=Phaeosphaeria nodorum (strain SN15 / ATCC MYA-4574 / FGSC 10173) TaxID=321614 RepID=A9JXE6_PHANO|nr:hypothetical protein SNOG_20150 [Parastagonospora nodorum SN15]
MHQKPPPHPRGVTRAATARANPSETS